MGLPPLTKAKRASAAPRRSDAQTRAQRDDYVEWARRMLRVDEEERRRLSLALHKTVTQSLAALATNLDLIDQQATFLPEGTRGLLLASRLMARDCFKQLRLLTDQLSPPLVVELGLPVAVRCVVASFAERTGITVACEAGDCPRLRNDVELAFVRLVEDCLENLDPLGAVPSIALRSLEHRVELHVRPVRPAVAARWKRRVALQFETDIQVRTSSFSHTSGRASSGSSFGLTIWAKRTT